MTQAFSHPATLQLMASATSTGLPSAVARGPHQGLRTVLFWVFVTSLVATGLSIVTFFAIGAVLAASVVIASYAWLLTLRFSERPPWARSKIQPVVEDV